jgi:hypothetical protein
MMIENKMTVLMRVHYTRAGRVMSTLASNANATRSAKCQEAECHVPHNIMMCDASFTKHTYYLYFNTFRPLPNDRLSLENSKTEEALLYCVSYGTESSTVVLSTTSHNNNNNNNSSSNNNNNYYYYYSK